MTHADITDKTLRAMYAKELLTIRRAAWNLNLTKNDVWVHGLLVGTDTVFRRMQFYLCTNVTLEAYLKIPIAPRRVMYWGRP